MSTAEIKTNLYMLIDNIEDSKILKAVYEILSKFKSVRKKNNEVDWWSEISMAEQKSIERGLNDLKNGKSISHDEVMQKYKAKGWL